MLTFAFSSIEDVPRSSESETPNVTPDIKEMHVNQPVIPEPLVSLDSQKSTDKVTSDGSKSSTNLQEPVKSVHEDVKGSILTELPSLDSVAAESINTHEIPTFNEFHAMVSEGAQPRKSQEVGEDSVPKSEYVLDAKESIKNTLDPQTSDKASQAHIDTNPSVKTLKGHGIKEALDGTVATDSSNIPSNSVKTDSHLEQQYQSLKGSSDSVPDDDKNSKGNSPVTPEPIATRTTVHTPNKGDVTLRRNVASIACGAKMLGSSKAIKNSEAVLNENNDEYMNVPCSEEKWLILEVCQPVQLRTIELANFELFSSRLKSFRVSASDRYPAKSWELIGTFTARDVKGIQSFSVTSGKMIKYIKFELTEHYGSEHYCPLTMIRIFGLGSDDLDDDDDDDDIVDVGMVNIQGMRNNHKSVGAVGGDNNNTAESEKVQANDGNNSPESNVPPHQSTEDDPSVSSPSPSSSSSPSQSNNEANTNLQQNHSKSSELEPSMTPSPFPTTEDSENHDSISKSDENNNNNDNNNKVNPMIDHYSVLFSISMKHQQDKRSMHATKDDGYLSYSKNNGGVCMNNRLVQSLIHKPYCSALSYRQHHSGDTERSSPPTCHTTKLLNTVNPPTRKSHLPITTTTRPTTTSTKPTTEKKGSILVPNDEIKNTLLNNNLTLQLRNKTFSQVVDEISIVSRLTNAVKRAVFGTFSQFFTSVQQDSTTNYYSPLEIVPTSEHYTIISYLFSQQGFTNRLCKDSLAYLTVNQIEGLWQLKSCLISLNEIYSLYYNNHNNNNIQTSSNDNIGGFLLWLQTIHISKLDKCQQAVKQLNLTLFFNYQPSDYDYYYYYDIDKSILHMCMAYQHIQRNRTRQQVNFIGSQDFAFNDFNNINGDVDEEESCGVCYSVNWQWAQLNKILWNRPTTNKCSKLPSFLFSSEHTDLSSSMPDSVYSDTTEENDEKILVDDFQSTDNFIIGRNMKSSDHRLPTRKIDRQHPNLAVVVPADLGGSRRSTAYMRLNNRVRIIERNVSVSMRYLEELSQSYRRQMERLSRSFNLTYAWLKVTAHGAEERDRQQQIRIAQLEAQLNDITARLTARTLNPIASSSSAINQPDSSSSSSCTPAPTTATSPAIDINSPSPSSTSASSESCNSASTGSKSTHLVSSSSSSSPSVPPPLPDFESSPEWHRWFNHQKDFWDGPGGVGGGDDIVNNEDDGEFESDDGGGGDTTHEHEDIYSSRFNGITSLSNSEKEKSKQTMSTAESSSTSSSSSSSTRSRSTISGGRGSISSGNSPNVYNSKSLFYPYVSAHHHYPSHHHHKHKDLPSNWKQLIYNWLWIQFTWPISLYDLGVYIHKTCQANSVTCSAFSLMFLHLLLAAISHLFIYWTWLRPYNNNSKNKNRKNKFGTEVLLLSSSSSSPLYRTLCSHRNNPNANNLILCYSPNHLSENHSDNNQCVVNVSLLPPSSTNYSTAKIEFHEDDLLLLQEEKSLQNLTSNVSTCCYCCCSCYKSSLASSSCIVSSASASSSSSSSAVAEAVKKSAASTASSMNHAYHRNHLIQSNTIVNNPVLKQNGIYKDNDKNVIINKINDKNMHTACCMRNNQTDRFMCDDANDKDVYSAEIKKEMNMPSNVSIVNGRCKPLSIDRGGISQSYQSIIVSNRCYEQQQQQQHHQQQQQFSSLPELSTSSIQLNNEIRNCKRSCDVQTISQSKSHEYMKCTNSHLSMRVNPSSTSSSAPASISPLPLHDNMFSNKNIVDAKDSKHNTNELKSIHQLSANFNSVSSSASVSSSSTLQRKHSRPNKKRRRRKLENNKQDVTSLM
ncbi:unnamed protein product [Trichobilharzia szidati]|nr:unnamed protein product [Trichobilharzia szidati]